MAPRVDRPDAPADYGFSPDPEGLLDWARVSDAIAGATLYWVASARPDGSPNLHSIWGGFVNDRLYIEGGDTTRWARNLAADPRLAFGVESADLHISGRGTVRRGQAGGDFAALQDNYASKHDYRPENDDFWVISPRTIIALDMSSMESFATSPTRFTFEEAS